MPGLPLLAPPRFFASGHCFRYPLIPSPVEQCHHVLGIARARRDTLGRNLVKAAQILRGHLHFDSGDVLLQVFPPLGARDRNDILTLCQ